jgi:hypothetical protein
VRAQDPAAPWLVQRGHEGRIVQPGHGASTSAVNAGGGGDPGHGGGLRREVRQGKHDHRLYFEAAAGASGRSASTTNSGLPSLSAYRQPSPAAPSGTPVMCPASRAVSAR